MRSEKLIGKNYFFGIYIKYFLITALMLSGFTAASQQETLIVICNIKGAPSSMKLSELTSVMMGEVQRWNGGTKVKIALMDPRSDIGQATANKIYKMSGDALNKHWLKLTFAGKAEKPEWCKSALELIAYVVQNPGAIGIINDPNPVSGFKIISINGKNGLDP